MWRIVAVLVVITVTLAVGVTSPLKRDRPVAVHPNRQTHRDTAPPHPHSSLWDTLTHTRNRRQPAAWRSGKFGQLPAAVDNRGVAEGGREREVEAVMEAVMQCKNVPGMAVAVVKGGERWAGGFGVKDTVSGAAVDSGTLFGIGSLTKAFTSALLAMALQHHNRAGARLSWQTLVKEVIGSDLDLTRHLQVNVTLEDILSHRTGIMAADIMAVAGFPANMTRATFLRELRNLPAVLPFRRYWNYNNWIYSLASDVTEYLLGDTWKKLLKERLLAPLGMGDSAVLWEDVNVTSPRMARPYQRIRGSQMEVDKSLFDLRQGKASGSLAVSADDMTRWMDFLLSGGLLPSGARLLDSQLLQDMMTPHIPVKGGYKDVPVGDTFSGYGFGWFLGTYRDKAKVTHTGGWFGYESIVTLFPDDDVGVYVTTNGPGTDAGSDAFRAITYLLSDMALGYSPWLNQTTACALGAERGREERRRSKDRGGDPGDMQGQVRKKDDRIQHPHRMTGTYSNPLFGEVVISRTADHYGLGLSFQRLQGFLMPGLTDWTFEVMYTGTTAFYSQADFDVARSTLSFSDLHTTDGQYRSLVLRAPPPNDFDRLRFTRLEESR
ncbi:uncharacterized protein LOC143298877 [Babylonia areolata]|uniref:uncharacterized protein LOC143298877 n=1 Tax=Babylonia areolata TaxID=304850 RepID=UPI003FD27D82